MSTAVHDNNQAQGKDEVYSEDGGDIAVISDDDENDDEPGGDKLVSHNRRKNKELKQRIQLAGLLKFYRDNPKFYKTMCSIINQKHRISLRSLDFLCSKMSRVSPIFYETGGCISSVANAYDNSMDTYGKQWFDAFKRSERIAVNIHNERLVSTIGQLTFFKVLKKEHIIDYAVKNISKIEHEMSLDLREIRQKSKRSRKKKTESQPRKRQQTMHVHKAKVVVKFI